MKIRQLAVAAVFLVASSLASANVQYTFYASGVTESYAQEGTALFSFSNDGSSLSITLTDTVDPTAAILSSITGLQFGLSSAPTSMSLVSVSAAQVVDCTNSSNPCPLGGGSSPYGWGSVATAGGFSLGAGFDGSSFAYQPYGIVNAHYLSPGGLGGLGDPASNPLLVGPVTFNFALTGLRVCARGEFRGVLVRRSRSPGRSATDSSGTAIAGAAGRRPARRGLGQPAQIPPHLRHTLPRRRARPVTHRATARSPFFIAAGTTSQMITCQGEVFPNATLELRGGCRSTISQHYP